YDVQNLYNWAPGPLGYWNLDEGSGNSVFDRSGNGDTGTFNGNPKWRPGKYGGAAKFGGGTGSGYVDLGFPFGDNPHSFTYEIWYKATAAPTSDFAGFIGEGNKPRLHIRSDGSIEWIVFWTQGVQYKQT